ncbi:MAG: peptide deformylase [Clostridia bacterium]|nr:peptide deformylase [Clostridia bacterium]
MALRNILKDEDPQLRKVCRPVTEFNERLWQLLDDMAETMYAANGVGLAGPQVGILRRLFVMDVGDGLVEAINPEILSEKGEQTDQEGCLSFPEKWGYVTRPQRVKMKAQDRNGKWFILTGEDLKARCICHETDHLNGVVFLDHVTEILTTPREPRKR